jgi:aldehyde:ferredoxin oxidoreductase
MNLAAPRFGSHGRVLHVDLTARSHRVEEVGEEVYKLFLGGYGLGAWLMWKIPPAPRRAPQACFAICAGLLTGTHSPFSSRIQIVGKSPLTGTWADSNSGGSVASQLRACGYDALVVHGRADRPTVLVVRDGEVRFDDAGELWGQQVPESFDALRKRYGDRRDVGVSAIGPAGERGARIASVMNDRYHAFGRQGRRALRGQEPQGDRGRRLGRAAGGAAPGSRPCAADHRLPGQRRPVRPLHGLDVADQEWMGWMYRLFPRR